MSRSELLERYWDLFQRIYNPDYFAARLDRWLDQVGYFPDIYPKKKSGWIQYRDVPRLLGHFLFRSDPRVRRLFFISLKKIWRRDPRLLKRAFTLWAQYRHFYDFVNRPFPVEREA
jgi:hypothetical protein